MNIKTTPLHRKEYQQAIQLLDDEKQFAYLPDAFTPLWSVTPDGVPRVLWAIRREGEFVGAAGYAHAETDRRLGSIGLIVARAYRRQGIGSQVLAAMLDTLRKHGVQRVLSKVYADQVASLHFLTQRGFSPSGGSILCQLEVASAQVSKFDDPETIVGRQGFRFARLDQFPRWGLAERLLPIWNRTRPDQPQDWPYQPYSAARLEQEMFESGELALQHSYAIVTATQQIVALTLNICTTNVDAATGQTTRHLFTVYSAVDPDFRQQKLATALKLKLITQAQVQGIDLLSAENDPRNIAMWHINCSLGYCRLTDLVTYQKIERTDSITDELERR